MFEVNIVTIFPEVFPGLLNISILARARKKKIWDLKVTDIKEFLINNEKIDDRPFGGGPGMIIKPDILQRAYEKAIVSFNNPRIDKIEKIMLTPTGENLNQEIVEELSTNKEGMLIMCGRYEGVDERFIEHNELRKISIGNYVLSGGETAAIVLTEAVVRFLPNVLGNENSKKVESFNKGLLEYPQYTKPRVWKNKSVPEVLLSGNHAKVDNWRKTQSEIITKKRLTNKNKKNYS